MLTSEKAKWKWGPDQTKSFTAVRNTIAHQVLLKYPDFSKPFEVYADASDYQLGAVITQNSWPVAFYSRKLNSAQHIYTKMEQELLSIVETSQQYRHILLGSHCKFYCGLKNLIFQNFKSKRVKIWRATLAQFDYSFQFCPENENTFADMLSHCPMTTITTDQYEEVTALEDSFFPATIVRLKSPRNLSLT